ncbi:adenine-specific methyltransferase EcoRI family protein [Patescibacteria group bacterium]|nr:adenine-specific methyltransferase EcoRI family protein [Patescibacteria group bacterium]
MKIKSANKNLHTAKASKKDEFYTQLTDIENELKHYKDQFRGKVVFCNCDDPKESNFVKYLTMNFEHLGLKKLIATHYKEANLFTHEAPYKLEYTGGKKGNRMPDPSNFMTKMIDTGDFRSQECIDLLNEADIVVTNPPFSLFREYLAQLAEYNKKFLIIGNINAITYKECFKLIKDNKMWLGASIHSGDREFRVPDDYPLNAAGYRVDSDGHKYIRVKGVRWFTNLDYEERHESLVLYKKYVTEEYPKYDNYDAINIDKTNEIPMDYNGIMGVPVTFLDKYNPEQFEVLGITDRQASYGFRTKKYTPQDTPKYNDLNARAVLNVGGELRAIYARVLIRNKR